MRQKTYVGNVSAYSTKIKDLGGNADKFALKLQIHQRRNYTFGCLNQQPRRFRSRQTFQFPAFWGGLR